MGKWIGVARAPYECTTHVICSGAIPRCVLLVITALDNDKRVQGGLPVLFKTARKIKNKKDRVYDNVLVPVFEILARYVLFLRLELVFVGCHKNAH